MKRFILIILLTIMSLFATNYTPLKIVKLVERNSQNSIKLCMVLDRYIYDVNSEKLKNYIKVTPKTSYGILFNYDAICINNLKPQTTYSIYIDKSATIGNLTLDKSYTFTKKTTNYEPSIEFSENGYILPSQSDISIPLDSINVKRVKLKLYRINRNNLINMINSTSLKDSLYNYDLDEIENEKGYLLWEKYLNIDNKLNKKVTTAIPVGKTIKKRKSGVYILAASIVNKDGTVDYGVKTQWFMISDIGLFTLKAKDKLHIYTKHLSNATPYKDVKLELIAKNNELLAKTVAKKGYAYFNAALLAGKKGMAPKAIYAYGANGDFSVLNLDRPSLDLTDRGDSGREVNGNFDAFIYSNRSIFKPNSKIPIDVLIRDSKERVAIKLKVSIKLIDPKGNEIAKKLLTTDILGHLSTQFSLPNRAGRYSIEIYADNEKPIGRLSFSVEDFIPPKIEAEFINKPNITTPNSKQSVKLKVKYLTGEILPNPQVSYALILHTTKSPTKEYKDYYFGKEQEEKVSEYIDENRATGDNNGTVSIPIKTSFDSKESITKPLALYLKTSIFDPGGRAIEKGVDIPFINKVGYIGIKPLFENGAINLGERASFNIIYLKNNQLTPKELHYKLIEQESEYNWRNSGDDWEYYVTYSDLQTIKEGNISTTNKPTPFNLDKLDWGSYKLEIIDNSGDITTYHFRVGYDESASAISPDRLPISTDKLNYKDKEEIQIKITPKFNGPIIVNIANSTILESKEVIAKENEPVIVKFKAKQEWGSSVYILASAFRAQSKKLGASRAIGLAHIKINKSKSKIDLSLNAPKKIRSKSDLNIAIKSKSAKNKTIFITLAAVDKGVLNLTNYKFPDPYNFFFGKKRLGIKIKDIYAELIKAHGQHAEFDVGSDEMASLNTKPTTNKREVVAFLTKAIKLDKKGKANVTFKIPDFQGKLELFSVAWSKDGVGSANSEVIVKDPVSIESYLPKFLSVGDISKNLLQIRFDKEAQKGNYRFKIKTNSAIKVEPNEFNIEYKEKSLFTKKLTIKALKNSDANITVVALLNNKEINSRNFKLAIREPLPKSFVRKVGLLDSQVTLDTKSVTNSNSWRDIKDIKLSLSSKPLIAKDVIKKELLNYCCRCAEQTTSRALAFIDDKNQTQLINSAIKRVYDLQNYDGGFGLWSSSSSSLWVTSYVTEFLTKAQENGFEVSQKRVDSALKYLQSKLNKWSTNPTIAEANTYALYILAKNKKPLISEINYHINNSTPLQSAASWAYLAASLDILGEKDRAKELFTKAKEYLNRNYFGNYGGVLRDKALLILLANRAGFKEIAQPLFIDLAQDLSTKRYLSTQEMSYTLRVAKAIDLEMPSKLKLKIDGKNFEGDNFTKRYKSIQELPKVTNLLNNSIWYNISYIATPKPKTFNQNENLGFSIHKKFFTTKGKELDIKNIAHSQELVVVISGKIEDSSIENALLIDMLPAGLEIENPNIIGFNPIESISWLKNLTPLDNVEYRDDRFIAAIKPNTQGSFTIAYLTRATTLGKFNLAPAIINDMYKPQFRAISKTASILEIKLAKDIKPQSSNNLSLNSKDYQKLFTTAIKDVNKYTTLELNRLRNSIFAQAGLNFKDSNEELHKLFSKFNWYKPYTTNSTQVYNSLNQLQKDNIQKLLKEEKARLGGLTLADFYRVDATILDKNYLKRYPKEQLRILRNSLIARYGYIFKDKTLNRIFRNLPWYKPNPNATTSNIIDNLLNPIEHTNLMTILEVEKELGK